MVVAMAFDGARAPGRAMRDELESAIGRWRRVVAVEVDQVRIVCDAMGIVASGARCLVVHYVFAVILEALIGQDTLAAVAFVAQSVTGRGFRSEIGEHQLTLEQRFISGAVWSVGTGPTSPRPLVVVMTIRALHKARRSPWSDQARHIGISSSVFDGMK